MKPVLILGAKSDMARALSVVLAKNGYDIYLASRASGELAPLASDLAIRHNITAKCVELDVLDFASHATFYKSLEIKPVGVVSFVGYMGDQKKSESDWKEALRVTQTNYTGIVSILNIIANNFEYQKSGFIVGVSSVAGERGRQSNYLYGAAKAAFSAYLSGLRNRLSKSGVHVMTVKPGFVYTKMTEGLNLPKPLTGMPEIVAKDIFMGIKKKKNCIYTLWMWRYIMFIIRNIPEPIFKKLSL